MEIINQLTAREIKKTLDILKKGGIAVIPTDTAYALVVDALNPQALKRLFKFKKRSFKKPLPIMVKDFMQAGKLVKMGEREKKIFKKFLPGPLTLVLPSKKGRASLGIRIPKNKICLSLLKKFKKPLTCTSANLSGKKPSYSLKELMKQFKKEKPDLILDSGILPFRPVSTVVDLTKKEIKILRRGPIKKKEIIKCLTVC